MSIRADGPTGAGTREWGHGRGRGPAPPARGGGTVPAHRPLLPPIRRRKRDTGASGKTTTGVRSGDPYGGVRDGDKGEQGEITGRGTAPVRERTGAVLSAREARGVPGRLRPGR
ncbi:hypothetical protein GCM10010521_25520 [Streptomyces rameus]|uniref:Uncharacterized protein n=1 Tax=Streptomyces rameus TaxID=68261 RepID=A0ABP6N6N8_9ACTN